MFSRRCLVSVAQVSFSARSAPKRYFSGKDAHGMGVTAGLAPQVHQTISGRSRFYKKVGVDSVEEGGLTVYRVLLDGRVLKTPARTSLHLPTLELAMAIAAEWDAQTDVLRGIQPRTMPLMTLASTAIDQVAVDPTPTKTTILSYLPTDSALFFTTDEDRILLRKQKQHFQPTVRWLKRTFGIEVKTTVGFSARIQHDESAARRLGAVLDSMDAFSLACLQGATMECKSVLLGLAYVSRHLTLEQTRIASRLEEECQIEWWGAVEGGHDLDRLNNAVSLSSVGAFMGLLWSPEQHEAALRLWVAASQRTESGV